MLVALLKDGTRSQGFTADLAYLDRCYASFPYLVAALRCHRYERAQNPYASDSQVEAALAAAREAASAFNGLCEAADLAPFCEVDLAQRGVVLQLACDVAEELDAWAREKNGRVRESVLAPAELADGDLAFMQDRDDRIELGPGAEGRARVDVERAWHNRFYAVSLSCSADEADEPPVDALSISCTPLEEACLGVSFERLGRSALVASVSVPSGLRFGSGELDFLRQRVQLAQAVVDLVAQVLQQHYPHISLAPNGFRAGTPWMD